MYNSIRKQHFAIMLTIDIFTQYSCKLLKLINKQREALRTAVTI